jgi:hypothetical protein
MVPPPPLPESNQGARMLTAFQAVPEQRNEIQRNEIQRNEIQRNGIQRNEIKESKCLKVKIIFKGTKNNNLKN